MGCRVCVKVCVVETGSLNWTMWPLVYRMGVVCTGGGGFMHSVVGLDLCGNPLCSVIVRYEVPDIGFVYFC